MVTELDYKIATNLDVEKAVSILEENLKEKGYGIVSRIDVSKILKEKNNQEIEPYLILDICNPKHAGAAMDRHREIGLVLPCKISVHREGSVTEVSLYRPTTAIGIAGFDDMNELAEIVESDLKEIVGKVSAA